MYRSSIALLIASVALVACESDEFVAEEMERGLFQTSLALTMGISAVEVLSHVYDEPDTELRHGGLTCGCPCTERIGPTTPFVMNLDYMDGGCVPESGILPTALTGHAAIDWDGERSRVTWADLLIGLEHEAAGDLGGTVELSDETMTVAPDGVLILADAEVAFDLQVVIGEELAVDGSAEVAGDPSASIAFEDVTVAVDGGCITPMSGTARMTGDSKEVVIRFDKPGDGFVQVERDGRTSESADWCEYKPDLW